MRTIETKIISTLRGWNGEGIKNLSCRDCVEVDGNTKRYYLWDNLLFWNDTENNYYFSARGWSSKTTQSRLNCILENFFNARIYQELGLVFRMERQKYSIDSESIFMFKGNKLYKLGAHEEEIKPF